MLEQMIADAKACNARLRSTMGAEGITVYGNPDIPGGRPRQGDVCDESIAKMRERDGMTWRQIAGKVGLKAPALQERYKRFTGKRARYTLDRWETIDGLISQGLTAHQISVESNIPMRAVLVRIEQLRREGRLADMVQRELE